MKKEIKIESIKLFSLRMGENLHKAFKEQCVREGKTMYKKMNELIQEYMDEVAK